MEKCKDKKPDYQIPIKILNFMQVQTQVSRTERFVY